MHEFQCTVYVKHSILLFVIQVNCRVFWCCADGTFTLPGRYQTPIDNDEGHDDDEGDYGGRNKSQQTKSQRTKSQMICWDFVRLIITIIIIIMIIIPPPAGLSPII